MRPLGPPQRLFGMSSAATAPMSWAAVWRITASGSKRHCRRPTGMGQRVKYVKTEDGVGKTEDRSFGGNEKHN